MYDIWGMDYRPDAPKPTFALHDSNNFLTDRRVVNAKVELTVGEIGQVTFSIYAMHPEYDSIRAKITHIRVFKRTSGGRQVFNGFISKIQHTMDSSGKLFKNVVCECALGFFYDSVQTLWQPAPNPSFDSFVNFFLQGHNRSHPRNSPKHILKGNLVPPSLDDNLEIGYQLSFDVLKFVKSTFGGVFRVRSGNDGHLYFDYNRYDFFFDSITGPDVKLAHNLQSLEGFTNATELVNRLYPYGARMVDEFGPDTKIRLNIGSINGHIQWIEDRESIEKNGLIVGVEIYDHVDNVHLLLDYAKVDLAKKSTLLTSFKITALDLSLINVNIADFEVGCVFKLTNELMGIKDAAVRVRKMTIDIDNPQRSCLETHPIAI